MLRRVAYPVVVMVVLVGAALKTMGGPDLSAAAAFVRNSEPTQANALAVVTAILWLALALFCAFIVSAALREARSAAEILKHRKQRAIGVVLVGVLLLGVGVWRHTAATYSVGGGSTHDVEQLVK
ncbi:MAG: hypothetical protein ACYDGR_17760 [Candidatus Dormibacteria bacterium]